VIGTSQRQCLVADRDLKAGDPITLETVRFAFPCKGIPVEHWDLVSTWRITAPVKSGQPIRWEQVGPAV
jgi:sialic acid synthase SpsE